jgi:single-stranded-DNA-specific exonuclease
MGNPEPVFLANHVQIVSSATIGRNTRRMIVRAANGSGPKIPAIQFNAASPLPPATQIHEMAYRLRWNHWNGNHTPQILVEEAIFSLQSPMSETIMRTEIAHNIQPLIKKAASHG